MPTNKKFWIAGLNCKLYHLCCLSNNHHPLPFLYEITDDYFSTGVYSRISPGASLPPSAIYWSKTLWSNWWVRDTRMKSFAWTAFRSTFICCSFPFTDRQPIATKSWLKAMLFLPTEYVKHDRKKKFPTLSNKLINQLNCVEFAFSTLLSRNWNCTVTRKRTDWSFYKLERVSIFSARRIFWRLFKSTGKA